MSFHRAFQPCMRQNSLHQANPLSPPSCCCRNTNYGARTVSFRASPLPLKMPDICTRICTAGRTVTALLNRAHILLILLVEQIKLAVIRVYMSVAAVSAWVYTVKEVDSSLYTLKYIGRSSYSHQVCRFINRQMRHCFIKNMVHLLMALLPPVRRQHSRPAQAQKCALHGQFLYHHK